MKNWTDAQLSQELPVLRSRGESQALEYIARYPDNARELAKEIAAFATANGGLILLGVADDGDLLGLDGLDTPSVRDGLVKRIEGLCHGAVKPPVKPPPCPTARPPPPTGPARDSARTT